MIRCPNCQRSEYVGTLFCSFCGVQLPMVEQTQETITTGSPFSDLADLDDYIHAGGAPKPGSPLTLVMMDNGEMVTLPNWEEVTLGRASDGQSVIPDIDLTPYRAYEGGVSRLHASLQMRNNRVTVTDLGSANGTRINGIKIPSHQPQPIHHGDTLTLGRLKIQVRIHR